MKILRCYGGPLDGETRPWKMGKTLIEEVPPDLECVQYRKVTVYRLEPDAGARSA